MECGLKACVLVRLAAVPELVFEDRRLSERCWTHNLPQLIDLAGLKAALDADTASDSELLDNWNTVKDWSESSRYQRTARDKAQDMYDGITNKRHGVLSWIKARW